MRFYKDPALFYSNVILMSTSDTDLKTKIIAVIAKKLKEGSIEPKITVPKLEKDGTKKFISVPIGKDTKGEYDASKYFEYAFKTMQSKMAYLGESSVLKMLAKDFGVGGVEKSEKRPITLEEMRINDIKMGMENISVKMVVEVATIKKTPPKDGKSWEILSIAGSDTTGTIDIGVFKDRSNADLFEAAEDKSLIGKTIIIAGAKAAYNKYSIIKAPFSLSLSRDGEIKISDVDLKVIAKKSSFTEITEATKSASFEGKVIKVRKFKGEDGKDYPYRRNIYKRGPSAGSPFWTAEFDIIDTKGNSQTIKMFNRKAPPKVPEEKQVVSIQHATIEVDAFRKERGDPNPFVATVDDEQQIKVIKKTTEVYPDKRVAPKAREKSLLEANEGERIEIIGYIYDLNSLQYDKETGHKVKRDPWWIGCTRLKDGKICKKGVHDHDGKLVCGNGHELEATETAEYLRVSAMVTDGTIQLEITLMGDAAKVVLGLDEKELLEEFHREKYDEFFHYYNTEVAKKLFKITGLIDVGKSFRPSLVIREIELISYSDAYAKELVELMGTDSLK